MDTREFLFECFDSVDNEDVEVDELWVAQSSSVTSIFDRFLRNTAQGNQVNNTNQRASTFSDIPPATDEGALEIRRWWTATHTTCASCVWFERHQI